MLLVGQTGSGKTELARKIKDNLELAFSPDEMKYALFDLKIVEFQTEHGNSKKEYLLFDVVNDSEDFGFSKLEELAALSSYRALLDNPKPLIFVYIEECDFAMMNQKRFDDSVITINQNARKANMKLIYSTSRPCDKTVSKRLLHSFELILTGPLQDCDYDYLEVPRVSDLKLYDFALTEK